MGAEGGAPIGHWVVPDNRVDGNPDHSVMAHPGVVMGGAVPLATMNVVTIVAAGVVRGIPVRAVAATPAVVGEAIPAATMNVPIPAEISTETIGAVAPVMTDDAIEMTVGLTVIARTATAGIAVARDAGQVGMIAPVVDHPEVDQDAGQAPDRMTVTVIATVIQVLAMVPVMDLGAGTPGMDTAGARAMPVVPGAERVRVDVVGVTSVATGVRAATEHIPGRAVLGRVVPAAGARADRLAAAAEMNVEVIVGAMKKSATLPRVSRRLPMSRALIRQKSISARSRVR